MILKLRNTKNCIISQKGASLVEAALIIALISVISVGSLTTLGHKADDKFCYTADSMVANGNATDHFINPVTGKTVGKGNVSCAKFTFKNNCTKGGPCLRR